MARSAVGFRELAFAAAFLFAAIPAHAAPMGDPDPIFADGFEPRGAGPGPTQSCPFVPDSQGFFTLTSQLSTYVARLPPDYDVMNPQPTRLLVALHGCGDTAVNFATWGAVPSPLRASQDYLAISIGGRDNQCWNLANDEPLVSAAIAHMRSCFYVDQRKIVLAGYSLGGMFAYKMALADALTYAGVLIENAGLSQAVGAANVDTVLDAAEWQLNVAHTARIQDGSFLIGGVRADRDKLLAHQFPLVYRELDGTSDGDSADWSGFLIPLMADWISP